MAEQSKASVVEQGHTPRTTVVSVQLVELAQNDFNKIRVNLLQRDEHPLEPLELRHLLVAVFIQFRDQSGAWNRAHLTGQDVSVRCTVRHTHTRFTSHDIVGRHPGGKNGESCQAHL